MENRGSRGTAIFSFCIVSGFYPFSFPHFCQWLFADKPMRFWIKEIRKIQVASALCGFSIFSIPPTITTATILFILYLFYLFFSARKDCLKGDFYENHF